MKKKISKYNFFVNFFKNNPKGKWLDLGFVSDGALGEKALAKGKKNRTWFHDIICQNSIHCCGVDFNSESVELFKKKNYNVIVGDVEKDLNLKEKYDYIFIGELIEHITNCAMLLQNCQKYLKPNGQVIFTTPNAYSYRSVLRQFFLNTVRQHYQHVAIYDYGTIKNCLERHEFEIKEFYYVQEYGKNIFEKLIDITVYFFKASFCSNLIVVAKRK